MAIILDADVIIRGEKGTFDLQDWLAQRPDDEFEIAAITVAELWHGVERAHREHTTFVVVKNGVALARLVPEAARRCTGRDLAAALAKASLSPDEARAWHEDLRSSHNTLRPPENKWR